MIASLLIASMLALTAGAKPAKKTEPARPLLVFYGNVAINDEVYRAVLDLPKEIKATPANAHLVRRFILDFLRRAGYELATVETHVEKDQIVVGIDEGRLDKVIILGEGAFQTLRFKLALSLPANVFNRPLLERQLTELSRQYNLADLWWELVPVRPVDHSGWQIENLENVPALEQIPIIAPGSPYELRIHVSHFQWGTGFAPEMRFDTSEGLAGGARYRARDIMFDNDRFEVRARAAGTLRGTIDGDSTRPVLSRAFLESRWYTPSLLSDELRSFIQLRGDLTNRQRQDLGLESFLYVPLEASLNLELTLLRQASLSVGAGLQHRMLFAIDRAMSVPVDPIVDRTVDRETRPFFISVLSLQFNLDEIRRDRRHELVLVTRFFTKADEARKASFRFDGSYQKMFSLGWHELWIKSHATILHGEVVFHDEVPIGSEFLRGPFGDNEFLHKIGAAGAEFRFSIARDLVKASVFHDFAMFGRLDRATELEPLGFANAFGVGLHVLFLDAFQFDAYFGVGFNDQGRFDQGLVLRIQQAF